uniref:Uncharacterized protein n=1 Tax=Chinchilla lanigera TaxID=34839 RepID=A0A8C2VYW0_CHILA
RRLRAFLSALFAAFQVLPTIARVLQFERPCNLQGGICLKLGAPKCEPFREPCQAFTAYCRIWRS